MLNRWSTIGLIVLLALALFQGATKQALADPLDRSWVSKVISLQGEVMVNRQGETHWAPARLSDTLNPGDRLRVEANSRAGIVLSNDAVLRLDQHTTLVFTEIEKERSFIFKLLKGAANFFSRRPRSLKVVTPFVNGVVEGTEFMVQVDDHQTRIDLFEGRIRAENPHGELQLTKGQGAVATAEMPPQRRILVKPRDSVQWALYYPPVMVLGLEEAPQDYKDSLALFNQGRPQKALNRLEQKGPQDKDSMFFAYRAALLLHLGRVEKALDDIQQATEMDPDNAEALALEAVIAVVQNQKEAALQTAREAVKLKPSSAAAQMALSYAHQAGFNLSEALQAAEAAVSHAPESATVWARLAELRLSTGKLDHGIRAAQKAVKFNPQAAHAYTTLGFAYLTQIKIKKARAAFERAINLDSAAPLPRMGLGLAKIRKGRLKEGRRELEIAAGLDPVNALIRSYLGKAYFDERRAPLDEKQLEIAKTLGPKDPTPWFYDAIRKQTLNRPVEALHDLEKSIELNNNRAVYRSRLLLDEDLAARSASLGRIYKDIGFQELSLRQGWRSLSMDPANYSAHRLLADSYGARQRHEIARVSELLQSQLLQPLNTTPVQPQLSESNIPIIEGAGPGSASFNEMNPLFLSNGITAHGSWATGSNDTRGAENSLSGLYDQISMSMGFFHYETDGYRENHDFKEHIHDIFVQAALSSKLNLQAEYRNSETEQGDLRRLFDPDDIDLYWRTINDVDTYRLGLNYSPAHNHSVIASYFQSESHLDTLYTDWNDEYNDVFDGYSAEGQYLWVKPKFSIVTGAGRFEMDKDWDGWTVVEVENDSYYFYSQINFFPTLKGTIGASYNEYEDDDLGEIDDFNPKLGLTWSPWMWTDIRMAYFQVLKRNLIADQTIEPTQVEGFNQFYDDFDGTVSKKYGLAIDQKISKNLNIGAEYFKRQLCVPMRLGSGLEKEDWEEDLYRAYIYYTFLEAFAVKAEYSLEFFNRDIIALTLSTPLELETHLVPLSVSYFSKCGLYLRATNTFVYQDITTDSDEQDSDSFSVVDFSMGYRFPGRYGELNFAVMNVFDEEFDYQGIESDRTGQIQTDPMFCPDRTFWVKLNLAF